MLPPSSELEEAYIIIEAGPEANAEHGIDSPDYLDSISQYIDSLSSALRAISLEIHDHPELQYKEFHAHRVLTEFLEKQEGWQVTPSAYGIQTAFVAVYDSGKKGATVSFNAEYGTTDISFRHNNGDYRYLMASLPQMLWPASDTLVDTI